MISPEELKKVLPENSNVEKAEGGYIVSYSVVQFYAIPDNVLEQVNETNLKRFAKILGSNSLTNFRKEIAENSLAFHAKNSEGVFRRSTDSMVEKGIKGNIVPLIL